MRESLHKVDIVIIALSSPIKIGIYFNNRLIECFQSSEKVSEYLPKIYVELLKNYDINRIIFAKGPGSFMSIKLTYVFLKTLNIARNISLKACDGFSFTKTPIKAVGKLYFIKENGKITIKKIEGQVKTIFNLPKDLKDIKFSNDVEPFYILPAV